MSVWILTNRHLATLAFMLIFSGTNAYAQSTGADAPAASVANAPAEQAAPAAQPVAAEQPTTNQAPVANAPAEAATPEAQPAEAAQPTTNQAPVATAPAQVVAAGQQPVNAVQPVAKAPAEKAAPETQQAEVAQPATTQVPVASTPIAKPSGAVSKTATGASTTVADKDTKLTEEQLKVLKRKNKQRQLILQANASAKGQEQILEAQIKAHEEMLKEMKKKLSDRQLARLKANKAKIKKQAEDAQAKAKVIEAKKVQANAADDKAKVKTSSSSSISLMFTSDEETDLLEGETIVNNIEAAEKSIEGTITEGNKLANDADQQDLSLLEEQLRIQADDYVAQLKNAIEYFDILERPEVVANLKERLDAANKLKATLSSPSEETAGEGSSDAAEDRV